MEYTMNKLPERFNRQGGKTISIVPEKTVINFVINLTCLEYGVPCCLAAGSGKVFTKAQIYNIPLFIVENGLGAYGVMGEDGVDIQKRRDI